MLDLVNFPGEGLGHLLIIAFNYAEGPRDLYALPIRVVSGEEARTIEVEYPATVIARIGQEGDLLVDSISSQAVQRVLLDIDCGGSHAGRQAGTTGFHQVDASGGTLEGWPAANIPNFKGRTEQ